MSTCVEVVVAPAPEATETPLHHMYDTWREDYRVGQPSIAVCGAIGTPIDVPVATGKWPRNICPRCMGMWEGL